MSAQLKMNVSLFGKHPSSSEYLHLGLPSDFMNAVAKWVEKGYETLLQNRVQQPAESLHHFSFFNTKERRMICGSMKLSHDSKHRKYPLVIAVEVPEYNTFLTPQQTMTFSKEISMKIATILTKECKLDVLKDELNKLALYRPLNIEKEEVPSAILMSEDFSEAKLFYRPLEINDFIETVR